MAQHGTIEPSKHAGERPADEQRAEDREERGCEPECDHRQGNEGGIDEHRALCVETAGDRASADERHDEPDRTGRRDQSQRTRSDAELPAKGRQKCPAHLKAHAVDGDEPAGEHQPGPPPVGAHSPAHSGNAWERENVVLTARQSRLATQRQSIREAQP